MHVTLLEHSSNTTQGTSLDSYNPACFINVFSNKFIDYTNVMFM